MESAPESRYVPKLRHIGLILDVVDPAGPMTESTRIRLAGETAHHDQADVAVLLALMPAVPPASTRSEYAHALRAVVRAERGGSTGARAADTDSGTGSARGRTRGEEEQDQLSAGGRPCPAVCGPRLRPQGRPSALRL